eukprot:4693047-Prymnesium_polylepis.1
MKYRTHQTAHGRMESSPRGRGSACDVVRPRGHGSACRTTTKSLSRTPRARTLSCAVHLRVLVAAAASCMRVKLHLNEKTKCGIP